MAKASIKKQSSKPKKAETKPAEMQAQPIDGNVFIIGTGTGPLKEGQRYSINEKTAAIVIERGHATLETNS